MVLDICLYNGEEELWDLHHNMLKPYVDKFVICEAPTTFSGVSKPLYFERIQYKYPDVTYYVIDENWTEEEKLLAWNSPNTQGAAHWTREFLQKESMKKALVSLDGSDLVFVGDVDEIWNPMAMRNIKAFPLRLKLEVYTYYLNNKSSEQFWGTLVAPYYAIKNTCLNHLRTRAPKSKKNLGWHFTSMGGEVSLRKKLTDSYTQESYAKPIVLDNLAYNIENSKDFLGRNFQYTIDESGWPQYLKDNRETFKELCR